MITIELDIFSGRPNPVWALTKAEENQLIERIAAEPSLTKPPVYAGGLGYRGYVITAKDESAAVLKNLGARTKFYLSGKEGEDAQLALLNTDKADNSVQPDVLQVAKDSIISTNKTWREYWENLIPVDEQPPETPTDRLPIITYEYNEQPEVLPNTPEPAPEQLPVPIEESPQEALVCGPIVNFSNTNFSFWNDSYSVTRNNCYNFASAYRSHTFAQPGRKSGAMWTSLSNCNNFWGSVSFGAAYDGYRAPCWTGYEVYGALVIWPGVDFHWYRYNTGGRWGHKPGSTPARNYDNSGRLITNPQTCNRGNYTLFCGYRYFPYGWTVR